MIFSPISGGTHQQRLESFYKRQAQGYDGFRRRLLHGREDMIREIPIIKDGVWVDMGGGTGNYKFLPLGIVT